VIAEVKPKDLTSFILETARMYMYIPEVKIIEDVFVLFITTLGMILLLFTISTIIGVAIKIIKSI
jgi:hypothetical protein